MTIQHRNSFHEFDAIYYLQQFVEHDRIVIIWSDALVLPSQKLQYRAQSHMTITSSGSHPTSGCVVHTNIKLYRKSDGVELNQLPESTKKAHNMALGALSAEMRRFWQAEQRRKDISLLNNT
ncbi:Hypothetical protein PHPALM_6106 [Phytophthora palmivora]|uniref:Uncharacterized protein n=1 Tax=Phytophthora palmivora TaxID=4796 RepID=A0A2P4YFR1_9STRA|nr:Hypothetical protein PHPALM_6106 [Phytophthora palmivora]